MIRHSLLAISTIEQGTCSKGELCRISSSEKKNLLQILLLSDKLGCKKLCPWMNTIFQILFLLMSYLQHNWQQHWHGNSSVKLLLGFTAPYCLNCLSHPPFCIVYSLQKKFKNPFGWSFLWLPQMSLQKWCSGWYFSTVYHSALSLLQWKKKIDHPSSPTE